MRPNDLEEWRDYELQPRTRNTLIRNWIGPEQARQLSDEQLLGLRNFGKASLADLRQALPVSRWQRIRSQLFPARFTGRRQYRVRQVFPKAPEPVSVFVDYRVPPQIVREVADRAAASLSANATDTEAEAAFYRELKLSGWGGKDE